MVTTIWADKMENGQGFLADHGGKAPIGRAAEANEIAEVVAFLASDRASFIVGSVVKAMIKSRCDSGKVVDRVAA